ncbi:hypothetical protein, conserved [Trypanosoma cruzi]|uniref:Amastin n=1 Tax=Trypanosoma cruzi (strain CL Brener) TaxID=353153 RepID=Q4D4X2_TRYCC|nr:hypothetical protein, conserved [Trypanosoma cruzi]EAN87572.1 hypothetical protein, conserved [Trypanosoma cruzi]|eukprot:XP_809423.1 hypothetical protein [Trypanosoma cruzi strain CL Brener]
MRFTPPLVLESLRLFFALTALVLAVSSLFFPVFICDVCENETDTSNVSVKGEITFWKHSLWPSESVKNESNKLDLVEYFNCHKGKVRIQMVEGIAIIVCVLTGANFSMCIFGLFFGHILFIGLIVYLFLAIGLSACVIGFLLEWYHLGWCEGQPPLVEEGRMSWKYGIGWILMVGVCAASLVGLLLSICFSLFRRKGG